MTRCRSNCAARLTALGSWESQAASATLATARIAHAALMRASLDQSSCGLVQRAVDGTILKIAPPPSGPPADVVPYMTPVAVRVRPEAGLAPSIVEKR